MIYEANCDTQTARNRLGSFLFSGDDVFKTVSMLSGGEQMRLRLCMLMDEKINLLILDEPTNHLDIPAREWIEEALADYEGALIFVSHDRYFVDSFATRIWELENQKIRDFPCDYQKYRSIKEHEAMQRPAAAPAPKKEKKEKPKNTYGLDKQLAKLEREIAKQEELVASYDDQIAAAATDFQELSRLMEEKSAADEALAALYEQWETLAAQLEGEE
jgi:ABC-type multidrug transport system ATPase subunit